MFLCGKCRKKGGIFKQNLCSSVDYSIMSSLKKKDGGISYEMEKKISYGDGTGTWRQPFLFLQCISF